MAPKFSPRVLAIGGVIYVATTSATYLYLKSGKPSTCSCPSHCSSSTSSQGSGNNGSTFDRIARDYDNQINIDETLMGVRLLRRLLVRQATGDVLEVSAGTGRNLSYLMNSQNINSVTLTDASREMLLRAHEKYSAAVSKAAGKKDVVLPRASFLIADVENLCLETDNASTLRRELRFDQKPLDYRIQAKQTEGAAAEATASESKLAKSNPDEQEEITRFGPALKTIHQLSPNSYDTVIDTFGLCSCENPVKALQEMVKALKPGGQLLLLEHGRSTWNFINRILDSSAEEHRKKWGCEWNRDIEALVKEAGLVVESISRWHFGTSYVIKCRKNVG